MYYTCGRFDQAIAHFRKIVEMKAADYQVVVKLAESFLELGDYNEALEHFAAAAVAYKKLASNITNRPDLEATIKGELDRIQVQMARCLWELNHKDEAFSSIVTLLKQDESDKNALIEYAHMLLDPSFRPDHLESLNVLLRCLVHDKENERIKRMISKIIKHNGTEMLIKILQTKDGTLPSTSAPAIAWIALIVRQHCHVKESIELYDISLELQPHNPSYVLNLVHSLELQLNYEACVSRIKNFLENYKLHSHHPQLVQPKQILETINSTELLQRKLKWTPEGARLQVDEKYVTQRILYNEPFSEDDLNFIALCFTLVKILFTTSQLNVLPNLIDLVESIRYLKCLHQTTIRNEHAYFCYLSQIMSECPPQLTSAQPLYICGDSHCLSPAWRTIRINGVDRLLKPTLVTGLKCWHLRPESDFYPKINFWNAVSTIPKRSDVIMMFGEIDCREGIWLAVEKCKYDDIDHGIRVAVDIYVDVLVQLTLDPYCFDIRVHPVMPVLDLTRDMVKKWNQILCKKIIGLNNTRIKWLDLFDNLLTTDGKDLKHEYKLDGTHAHPRYVSLIQDAINK
ncbi:hypothetical protein AKO1_007822 [Acrasis kona]|uniref:Uncharacterized protein n=1 Tax=Acrasis kona TaxID=1008807 RepID=A0AAW2YP81_9EUKA